MYIIFTLCLHYITNSNNNYSVMRKNKTSPVFGQLQLSEHFPSQSHSGVLCTFQFCFLALASLCTTLLACAGYKLQADFGCLREPCPVGLVHLVVGRAPPPVTWRGQCWCRNQSVAPDMPALVDSSSDMLLEGGTCRRYDLYIALLGKQFAACLVHIGWGACPAVEQDDEPLNGLHGIFIYVNGCSGEVNEGLCELR